MLTRMTLAVAAAGASLAFVTPALAAPSPVIPHQRPVHRTAAQTRTRALPAITAASPTEYVSTKGMDTNANGTTNTCRLSTNPCQTIQHAIDVGPNAGTIKVAAGTYPEQLTINAKNLRIVGAGAATTIIQPTSLTTDNNDPDSSSPEAVIVSFTGTTSAGLSNITVDGSQAIEPSDGACDLEYIGVEFANAGGALSSDTVTGVQEQPGYFGCQGGDSAVYVANNDGGPHAVTMTTLNVNKYNKDGITCVNAGTSCTITGSKVNGIGPTGLTAQNGIEIFQASAAKITGTTVTNNTYTSPDYTGPGTYATSASGVLVFQAGALTLSKNTLNHNDINAYLLADNTDYAPPAQGVWTVTGNAITRATNDTGPAYNPNSPGAVAVPTGFGVGDGLDLDGPNQVTVYGNTFSNNADWGLALFGTTNSTIGGSMSGQPNIVSYNGFNGIFVGEDTYNSQTDTGVANTTQPSAGDTIANNVVKDNHSDGIYAQGPDANGNQQDTGNTFQANNLQYNQRYDAEDLSIGTGTGGTANTWAGNLCAPAADSNPTALCTS